MPNEMNHRHFLSAPMAERKSKPKPLAKPLPGLWSMGWTLSGLGLMACAPELRIEGAQTLRLSEGAISGTGKATGWHLVATDADTPLDQLAWTVSDPRFELVGSADRRSLQVKAGASFDYEARTPNGYGVVPVMVMVWDGTSATIKYLLFRFEDSNDEAPVFTSPASVQIGTLTKGDLVYTASATDADISSAFRQITYSLKQTGDHASFAINAQTGQIWLAESPAKTSFSITVIASDGVNRTEQQITLTASLLGTDQNDDINGTDQGETINGLAGNDRIAGMGGDDILRGGPGNDIISGGEGADTLTGGAGRDILTGGAGNDVFVMDVAAASEALADVITDFTAGDKLTLGAGITKIWFKSSTDPATGRSSTDGNAATNDTILYAGNATNTAADTSKILAILEDYTANLTSSDLTDNFVTVAKINVPPSITGMVAAVTQGTIGQSGSLSYDLVSAGNFTTSDADGDLLAYSIINAADNSVINWLTVSSGGVVSFATGNNAPDSSKAGSHSLKLRADDGAGGIATSSAFTLTLGKMVAAYNVRNPFSGFDVGAADSSIDSSAPAFTDIDGDGDLDLVSGERHGTFKIWRNDGSSGYSELTGTANPLDGLDVGFRGNPAFVDIDGDGDLDLVSGEDQGAFWLWRNDGSSGYSELTGSNNPFNGFDVGTFSAPAFVDIDGDGDHDLVSGNYFGKFKVWRNEGSSGYSELTGSNNPFNGFDAGSYSAPAFVDIEGDGDLDLVSGDYFGKFKVWRNEGSSGYSELTGAANPFNSVQISQHIFTFDAGTYSKPAFADIDGDGDLDLVSGNRAGQFKIWYQISKAVWSAADNLLQGSVGSDV